MRFEFFISKKLISSFFIIILSILIMGCSKKKDSKGNVVAQVNESQITNTELEAAIPADSPRGQTRVKKKSDGKMD